jgi:hypothetical protein
MKLTLKLRQKKAGAYAQIKCGPHLIKEVRVGDDIESAEKRISKESTIKDSLYTAYRNLEKLKGDLDAAGWEPRTTAELRAERASAAEKLEQPNLSLV